MITVFEEVKVGKCEVVAVEGKTGQADFYPMCVHVCVCVSVCV